MEIPVAVARQETNRRRNYSMDSMNSAVIFNSRGKPRLGFATNPGAPSLDFETWVGCHHSKMLTAIRLSSAFLANRCAIIMHPKRLQAKMVWHSERVRLGKIEVEATKSPKSRRACENPYGRPPNPFRIRILRSNPFVCRIFRFASRVEASQPVQNRELGQKQGGGGITQRPDWDNRDRRVPHRLALETRAGCRQPKNPETEAERHGRDLPAFPLNGSC
jgi:hypothetical protein